MASPALAVQAPTLRDSLGEIAGAVYVAQDFNEPGWETKMKITEAGKVAELSEAKPSEKARTRKTKLMRGKK